MPGTPNRVMELMRLAYQFQGESSRFHLDLVIRTFNITECDYFGLSNFLDQIRDLWHWVRITLTVFVDGHQAH